MPNSLSFFSFINPSYGGGSQSSLAVLYDGTSIVEARINTTFAANTVGHKETAITFLVPADAPASRLFRADLGETATVNFNNLIFNNTGSGLPHTNLIYNESFTFPTTNGVNEIQLGTSHLDGGVLTMRSRFGFQGNSGRLFLYSEIVRNNFGDTSASIDVNFASSFRGGTITMTKP